MGGITKNLDPFQPIREGAKAVQDAGKAIEKGAQDAGKAIEEGAHNAGSAVEKAAQDTGKAIEKGANDVGHTVEKAVQDTGATLEKAGQDIGNFFDKAANDTVAQVGRSYGDIVELAEASYHFIENQVEGYEKAFADASKRVSEGKLIDAVWGTMVDPIRISEQSAADAVMESSLLNTIAASAAAVYGGPAGAAAYSAWYAYKATGNLEVALRAGAIAWATSTAGAATKGINGNTFDAAARRALASAAIGGAAVAASGGSQEQVVAAFGRGAVVGAAREAYKGFTKHDLDGKPASKGAILKLDKDGNVNSEVKAMYQTTNLENGNLDITSLPKEISHVGIATAEVSTDYWGTTETSGVMQDLGKLPYMNDMAYFHDQWMALTNTQGISVQLTILPAIAFIGMGTEGAQNNPATEVTVEKEKEKQATTTGG